MASVEWRILSQEGWKMLQSKGALLGTLSWDTLGMLWLWPCREGATHPRSDEALGTLNSSSFLSPATY